jgi:hypothetical protein
VGELGKAALLARADAVDARAVALTAEAAALKAEGAALRALAQGAAWGDGDRFTLKEAAARYRVSLASLRAAVRCGELAATVGRRYQPMVAADAVERWIGSRRVRVRESVPAAPTNGSKSVVVQLVERGELVRRVSGPSAQRSGRRESTARASTGKER